MENTPSRTWKAEKRGEKEKDSYDGQSGKYENMPVRIIVFQNNSKESCSKFGSDIYICVCLAGTKAVNMTHVDVGCRYSM